MPDDMTPGGGGRTRKMVAGMMAEGMSEERAKAIAAARGRKKYGKRRFQRMAARGQRRAARRRAHR